MMYKATIEYRDAYSHGHWSTHSVTTDTAERAKAMVLEHCADCEHREPKVEEVP